MKDGSENSGSNSSIEKTHEGISSENAHKHQNEIQTTSELQTSIAILKGNIGPGCLALPWSFSLLGVPLGCFITISCCVLVTYNAWTLVRLKREIWGMDKRGITYSDVGEHVYGSKFRLVVDISVVCVQLAVCTVFFSNMGENLSATMQQTLQQSELASNEHLIEILSDRRLIMLSLLPPILILTSLPNLKRLSPYITIATIFMCLTFVLIGFIISNNWESGMTIWMAKHQTWQGYLQEIEWKLVPLATCAIMYSLEGDQLILPIESSMTNPRAFDRVLFVSMTIVGVLFCVFASSCTIAFGNVNGGSITAFLMDHRVELQPMKMFSTYQILLLTNVIVSLSLLFTYPLQLFPAIGLMAQVVSRRDHDVRGEEGISLHNGGSSSCNGGIASCNGGVAVSGRSLDGGDDIRSYDNESTALVQALDTTPDINTNTFAIMSGMEGDSIGLRVFLVLITFVIAIIVPRLKALISLAGAVTGSATSLIIPPMLALQFIKKVGTGEGIGASRKRVEIFYILLMIIGWTYGLIGTVSSIQDILSNHNH